MENSLAHTKFLALVWGILVLFAFPSHAENTVSPNWNVNDTTQTRRLTVDYSGTSAVVGGSSILGNASNNSLTVNSLTLSTEDDPAAAINRSDYVAGGAVYNATASNNTVNITNNATVQGRTLFGGAAFLDNVDNRLGTGTASNNTVNITDSTISKSSLDTGGDVKGGFAYYGNGKADNNTVVINNSSIAGNVFGGEVDVFLVPGVDTDENNRLLVDLTYTADNNTVKLLNGSTANTVYGSYGTLSATGNTVLIDASSADVVMGAQHNGIEIYTAGTTNSALSFTNNTVSVVNGASVGDAYAIKSSSVNASGNSLHIDNSTVSNGLFYSVLTDLYKDLNNTPYNAQNSSNSVVLSNMSAATTAKEIAGSLNLAGAADSNTVNLSNLSNLTVARQVASFKLLNLDSLTSDNLLSVKTIYGNVLRNVNNFNTSYGFVYGGASIDYTTQLNDYTNVPTPDAEGNLPPTYTTVPAQTILANVGTAGTTSNGNTVYIKNSTVNANIAGGVAAQLQQVHYATWSYTPASDSDPANYTKTEVIKKGNKVSTYTYDCGASGTSCSLTNVSSSDTTGFDSVVFSANNNMVILEDSTIDGTVYGGYTVGADLAANNVQTSNNTVVLRGNTTLSNTAALYGGSSSFGQTTNLLVFDHVTAGNGNFVTYNSKDQFNNFQDVWRVQADLDTRVDFNFNNVYALVSTDNSVKEGSATIIKTQTVTDLTDVEQNGVLSDLTDNSVDLEQKRKGIYTYSLTPTKLDSTTVGWVLSSVKDSTSAEIYGQLPLVGVALAQEGGDLLDRSLYDAWKNEQESNVFVNGGYHHTQYETGSGFDLDSGIAQAGLWKKFTSEFLAGLFVKYAGGAYETYPIKATGTGSAYGGGLMASYRFSETGRLETEIEVGYTRLEFESTELVSTLKSKSPYYGAAIGLVETPINNWDVFAKLRMLRRLSDSVTDSLEQSIKYNALQSMMLRAGTQYTWTEANLGGLVPSLGVSGLYEFAGKSKLQVQGLSNSQASLKGLSGRVEAGLSYQSEEAMLPMRSALTLFGQLGNRRGFGGEVNISLQF